MRNRLEMDRARMRHRARRWLGAAVLAVLGALAGSATPAAAVEYVSYALEADRPVAGVCLTLSTPLPRAAGDRLAPFVELRPPADVGLSARGADLCLSGLRHGTGYTVRLRRGLTALDGSTLADDVTLDILVPDRRPSVNFKGQGSILPWRPGTGLPLESVNAGRANLALYRIGQRNLVQQVIERSIGDRLSNWGEERLADTQGQRLFTGRVELSGAANVTTVTLLPISELAGELQPGLHVATAWLEGTESWEERATLWFAVSDIGLFTVQAEDGLLVDARSLTKATPLAEVGITLLARNNGVLAELTTGTDGRVRLPAALLRGAGGNAPILLTAQAARGDLSFIELDRSGLDLSELDVQGRTPPGPLDAFLWTDRGVYRTGETVHLAMTLRDALARAVGDLPVSLALRRPDGIEAVRLRPILAAAGGGSIDWVVPGNAYSGVWTVVAEVGSTGGEVGRTSFVVEDFVPPRLEVEAAFAQAVARAAEPMQLTTQARYFFGAAGAELAGEVELLAQAAAMPFAALPDYRFGLVQEAFATVAAEPVGFATDVEGKASVELVAPGPLDSFTPLEVAARVRVFDVDGRPVATEISQPLDAGKVFIGIRADAKGELAEGSTAGFDIRLVDRAGQALGASRLAYSLVREDYDYAWFERDGRWDYETIVNDQPVTGGELALDAAGRGRLELPVDAGRFRLEVFTSDGTAATSLRFGAGWWAAAGPADRPETMTVTLQPDAPAGTVRAMIEPPFDLRALVMIAGRGLDAIQDVEIPKSGRLIELAAPEIPPGGAYLLVAGFAPSGTVLPRLPARAIGAAWLPGPLAARRLEVTVAAAEIVRPSSRLDVAIEVGGAAPGEPVFLTLAAVDEAVLRLTGFTTPDPAAHYLGRRALGATLRDIYGRLIDPTGQPGRIVSGGDAQAKLQLAGLDVRTTETVALFQGPVTVGADGRVALALDVPDFSGRLRLMAVAWTAARIGAGEAPVTVRPPLLAELPLPRFLAPGDRAQIELGLRNLEAPLGTYRATLVIEGPLALDRTSLTFNAVERDRRGFAPLTLTATAGTGAAALRLRLDGPEGFAVERRFPITVRPPSAHVTTRVARALEPGQSLTLDDALGVELLPGTGRLELRVTGVPAFDVGGLLASLDRYAYGCTEQTVSRAFPYLLAGLFAADTDVTAAGGAAVSAAIGRLFSLESPGGGFGVWSPREGADTWLTSYVLDFLDSAAARGQPVPDGLRERTARWLGASLGQIGDQPASLAAAAYASWVLARRGELDLARLRYLALTSRGKLPTAAATAQLAAALMVRGDQALAAEVLAAPPVTRAGPEVSLADYGSPLRDAALTLAVSAEARLRPLPGLVASAQEVASEAAAARYLSTQEEAWLLRAAAAFTGPAPLSVELDGVALPAATAVVRSLALGAGRELALRNAGAARAYAAWSVSGIPAEPQPAAAQGFEIVRSFHRRDGTPADLMQVRQTDQLVVLIEAKVGGPGGQQALLVDLLPAGLELEPVNLEAAGSVAELAWVGELTTPAFTALRDDRFVAAFELAAAAPAIRAAYLVRATTPGSFIVPPVQIEDMYAPERFGRGPADRLAVARR